MSNFKFAPDTVTVKRGERVHITAVSDQGVHNVFVDGYNARTAVKSTGGQDATEFVADKAGTFDMWCEVGSHKANGMIGKLIVE